MGKLRLKAILHYGKAVFATLRNFHKLAGEDVILAHRLLKNSIPSGEYVLETDSFHRLAGAVPGHPSEERTERYEGLGTVRVHVFYPTRDMAEVAPASRSLLTKIGTHLKIDAHTLMRHLGKPAKQFRNLGASDQ